MIDSLTVDGHQELPQKIEKKKAKTAAVAQQISLPPQELGIQQILAKVS